MSPLAILVESTVPRLGRKTPIPVLHVTSKWLVNHNFTTFKASNISRWILFTANEELFNHLNDFCHGNGLVSSQVLGFLSSQMWTWWPRFKRSSKCFFYSSTKSPVWVSSSSPKPTTAWDWTQSPFLSCWRFCQILFEANQRGFGFFIASLNLSHTQVILLQSFCSPYTCHLPQRSYGTVKA